MNDIVSRIKKIIEEEGISPNAFSKKIGFNQSNLSKVLNGSREVPQNLITAILNHTDVNKTWLLTGEGGAWNTKASTPEIVTEEVVHQSGKRPRVPFTVRAGKLTEIMSSVMPYDCEYIPVINAFPEYDFTIIVKGDSMEPKYEGGDEIACKRIDNTSFIQWGKPHVLDTAQGMILKRIYEDGDKIRCVSYNREYPDFCVDKDEIFSVSLVVGLIRI
jgi:phage repressor protein C with HTH and peptisase S24 domain